MLYAGSLVFVKPAGKVQLGQIANWWQYLKGAWWREPQGPGSSIDGLEQHPAVHVTFGDAEAFARWEKKELPTEAEWEFAARGGLEGAPYAWGQDFMPNDVPMANTWQGEFPWQNLGTDGYEGTSPVGAFPANGYGLHDVIGNVWEWTTDWYEPKHPAEAIKACCIPQNPRGGREEASYDPCRPGHPDPAQGAQGRVPSLCAELLPPLPARSTVPRAGGYLDQPRRLPLHRATGSMSLEVRADPFGAGPYSRVQATLGLIKSDGLRVGRRALLVGLIAWLPLLLLSAVAGSGAPAGSPGVDAARHRGPCPLPDRTAASRPRRSGLSPGAGLDRATLRRHGVDPSGEPPPLRPPGGIDPAAARFTLDRLQHPAPGLWRDVGAGPAALSRERVHLGRTAVRSRATALTRGLVAGAGQSAAFSHVPDGVALAGSALGPVPPGSVTPGPATDSRPPRPRRRARLRRHIDPRLPAAGAGALGAHRGNSGAGNSVWRPKSHRISRT